MSRIRSNIRNGWGSAGGADAQRADLWQVDLSSVIAGVRRAGGWCPESIPPYFAASISLPELRVKPEVYRRDSRAYQMPSFDDPLDSVKIMFHLDDATLATRDQNVVAKSMIYRVMDLWRKVVRAGRGALGAEDSIPLNANYTIEYAYPIYVYLLRGYGLPPTSFTQTALAQKGQQTASGSIRASAGDRDLMFRDTNEVSATRTRVTESLSDRSELYSKQMEEGLYISGILYLEWAWLGGFKVGELAYNGNNIATLETTIYCENIFQSATDPGV
jgi:hypothetical protein